VTSLEPPVMGIIDNLEPVALDEETISILDETIPSPSTPTRNDFDDDDVFVLENLGPARRVEDAPANPRNTLPIATPPSTVPSTTDAFIDQYRESIQPVTRLIEQQITRATWCGASFKVHPPAVDERINDISEELRRLCPTVLNLSEINRSNISKYRELDDVMQCHSRINAYVVQYFKQSLVAPCNCPACRSGIWSPFTLDKELAGSLPHAWQVVVLTMLLQMLLILLRFPFFVLLF